MLTTSIPTPVTPAHRTSTVLIPALFGSFLIILDASVVNVALPDLGRQLGANMAGLQWVVDGYTLMFAALLLSAGALADRIGAGRAFCLGLGGFALASAACGAAPTLGLLVAARFAQGVTAALVLPSSLALVRQGYDDPAKRAWAVSIWAVAGSSAIAAGPVLGGLLTAWSWRTIFLINVPVAAVALWRARRLAPSPRRATPLDPAGQITAVLALAGLTFALIEGGRIGYAAWPVLIAFGVAVLAGTAFAVIEARVRRPIVPPGLVGQRTVAIILGVGFTFNAAFYGIVFVLSLYLQQTRQLSPLATGLVFAPTMLLIIVANLASPRLAARFGPRVPIVVGQLIVVTGLLLLLAVGPATPAPLIAALAIPIGLGGGIAVPTLMTVLLDSVAPERAGMAGGIFNAVRQVGGATAVAIFGSLLAGTTAPRSGMTSSLLVAAVPLLVTAGVSMGLRRTR
ncbi:MFS transporter [Nocardia sp. NPDC004068]|uniref:MFS transporter n=1 Tax=Nocardia sp. NPDC004068 TaxID=3364303 RepID=UPI0036D0469F